MTKLSEVVAAWGPDPAFEDELMLFGQFVGSWAIDGTLFDSDGGREQHAAEWHFGWALGGRAIQDVLICPPRSEQGERPLVDYGTTIRFYDPDADAWEVTYISPVSRSVSRLRARPVDDRIVLEGTGKHGLRLRWSFNEITPSSFDWRGELSTDAGKTWFMNEQMLARRM